MKLVSDLAQFAVIVLSLLWFISDPSYEPAILLVGAITALIAHAVNSFRRRDVTLLLGRLVTPLVRWHDRRTSLASLEFDSLSNARALHHSVKAWSVWDTIKPSTWVELRHRQKGGSWTTFCRFEGYDVALSVRDVDGDGNPELVVFNVCGAHTRVVRVFRVGLDGFLALIPGSEIGSDWPEIILEDRDADGRVEIYAKHRNWSLTPTQDFIIEVYVYQQDAFRKLPEAKPSLDGPA